MGIALMSKMTMAATKTTITTMTVTVIIMTAMASMTMMAMAHSLATEVLAHGCSAPSGTYRHTSTTQCSLRPSRTHRGEKSGLD